MAKWTSKKNISQWLWKGIGLSLIGLLSSCNPEKILSNSGALNSRYNDEQPALSGDGRWLSFVSNRNGHSEILLYDLQQKKFENISGLNPNQSVTESPSLSRTGRYIVYIVSFQGRPDIALYDRITKRAEILTAGYRNWVRNPHISPEGRYIAFETSRRGQWDIEVLDRGPFVELDIPDGTPVVNP